MVKTGIYGMVRALTLLPAAPAWWGWLLIGIGTLSGIGGILFALAQHDLKRLLAYSTVENVGIITLGLGVGLFGVSSSAPLIAILGLSGALLHVVNHAMFKGLLFLGAGAVLHATGTREIDRLGGLAKRMPWVAGAVMVGAVAISGLPPLNGFVGEFLIYLGALRGETSLGPAWAVPSLMVLAALALIGGLAAVCFTKVVGIAFLGEPRTEQAAAAHPPGLLMTLPMIVLAVGCFLVGHRPGRVVAVASARRRPGGKDGNGDHLRSVRNRDGAVGLDHAGVGRADRSGIDPGGASQSVAQRPGGGCLGYVGMWLHAAHGADAIYVFLVRATRGCFLQAAVPVAADPDRSRRGCSRNERLSPRRPQTPPRRFFIARRSGRSDALLAGLRWLQARLSSRLHALHRRDSGRPLDLVYRDPSSIRLTVVLGRDHRPESWSRGLIGRLHEIIPMDIGSFVSLVAGDHAGPALGGGDQSDQGRFRGPGWSAACSSFITTCGSCFTKGPSTAGRRRGSSGRVRSSRCRRCWWP